MCAYSRTNCWRVFPSCQSVGDCYPELFYSSRGNWGASRFFKLSSSGPKVKGGCAAGCRLGEGRWRGTGRWGEGGVRVQSPDRRRGGGARSGAGPARLAGPRWGGAWPAHLPHGHCVPDAFRMEEARRRVGALQAGAPLARGSPGQRLRLCQDLGRAPDRGLLHGVRGCMLCVPRKAAW